MLIYGMKILRQPIARNRTIYIVAGAWGFFKVIGSLKEQYPNIDRFLDERGWIEMGENEMTSALVRAYDEGGSIYEGKSSYPTWDAALQDLDQGIADFMEENGLD